MSNGADGFVRTDPGILLPSIQVQSALARQTSSIPGRRRHQAVQLSPRWRDGLHMSTDADGFTRTERFSAPFRSQLPVDRCHLATLPIWPSAVTVERRAPSVNTRRRHYRTFVATLWSVNASVDHCWFVMTAKTAFGPCCLYYVCSLCLEFLRYLTNEKDIGIFVLMPFRTRLQEWVGCK